MSLIAGHSFSATDGLCTCGRRFSDISMAEREHIGKEHWAHTGCLTGHEFEQIVGERERIWRSLSGQPSGEAKSANIHDSEF